MKNKRLIVSILAGILAAAMIAGLILSGIPVKAASSSAIKEQIEELEKKQEEWEKEIEKLQGSIDANASEIKAVMEQKNLVDQQVGLLYSQINNLNEQIAAYNVLIADKQAELDEAQLRLETLTQQNRERIRAMEENGELTYWSVLAEANSFYDLLDRLVMVEEIAAADSRRLKEMSAAAEEVESAKSALLAEREALNQTKAEMDATQVQLEKKSEQALELLNQLIAKGAEFDSLMAELEEENQKITDDIAQKNEEYDEAKQSEYLATATQPTYSGGGNGGTEVIDPTGMVWLVPCDYTQVSSPFGMRYHPLDGTYRHHNGVDLWAPDINGKPIYATRSGYVSLAGWYGSGGWTVKIQHDSVFQSIYMHMTHFIVSEGDYVAAGQVIGYVGTTGGSTGPHLHFEVRQNGTPINPMSLIG